MDFELNEEQQLLADSVDDGKRLLWGGRITTRAASADGVARELRTAMLDVYPQLAPLKTELAWSGLMAYARHLMPLDTRVRKAGVRPGTGRRRPRAASGRRLPAQGLRCRFRRT